MTLEYTFTWFSFWITLILIAAAVGVIQGVCAYATFYERKISAWAQDRYGPNRVGPFGLLQPIVDGVKFVLKEEIIPSHADKLFYLAAPAISMSTALFAFAVVPFGPTTSPPVLEDYRPGHAGVVWPQTKEEYNAVLAADRAHSREAGVPTYEERLKQYNDAVQFVIAPHVDIGIIWVFAISSLAVYAIILGGWSSNNKYSLMGSLRSSAQLISYEIPLGLSALGVLLWAGSLNLERVIESQYDGGWNILFQPLAAVLFVTSVFAECNRLPFDLPEAEQELVAGYHTEYGALKFGMFMLGEYTHMITTSFLIAILFFGGWLLPGVTRPGDHGVLDLILKVVVLGGKMVLLIAFYMLIRWTLPRFRFDQLMGLTWKVMMPLGLASLVCVILVKYFDPLRPLGVTSAWLLLPLSLLILVGAGWMTLNMPRTPGKVALKVRGHNTGQMGPSEPKTVSV